MFFFVGPRYHLLLYHLFYSPSQLVRGVITLSDLLHKPWSQVSFLPAPGTFVRFYRA